MPRDTAFTSRDKQPRRTGATRHRTTGQRPRCSWRTGERGTRRAVFRAVGGYFSGGLGVRTRAIATGLGKDAERSGHRAGVLGERANGKKVQYLEQSSATRAALGENREQLPQDWAKTQNGLARKVLRCSWRTGERGLGARYLERSVAAYRAAWRKFTRASNCRRPGLGRRTIWAPCSCVLVNGRAGNKVRSI